MFLCRGRSSDTQASVSEQQRIVPLEAYASISFVTYNLKATRKSNAERDIVDLIEHSL